MVTVAEALGMAVDHHRAGRLADAESIYRKVLEVEPDSVDAMYLLGVLAHQVGRNDIAVEYIGRAVALAPTAERSYALGAALQGMGRLDDAVAAYGDAIARQPDFVEAHRGLATVLRHLGRWEEAIPPLRATVAAMPDDAEAHNTLGAMLQMLGRWDEAVAAYRDALRLRPDIARIHVNLGLALRTLDRLDEADVCFEAAVARLRRTVAASPDDADSRHRLGNVLMLLGNFAGIGVKPKNQAMLAEARDCLREALSRGMAMDSFMMLGDLGGIDDEMLTAGVRFARDLLRREPGDAGAMAVMLYYVYRRGRLDLMRRARARLLRAAKTPEQLRQAMEMRPVLRTMAMVRADGEFFARIGRHGGGPDVPSSVPAGPGPVVLVTGDDIYVRTYADDLLASIAEHCGRIPVHLHVFDPTVEATAFARRVACSFEDTTHIRPDYKMVYYTCGRFFVLRELLAKTDLLAKSDRPVIVTDIDMLCHRDLAALVDEHRDVDIGITAEGGRRGPHIDLCARFLYVNNTARSRAFIDLVCDYIAEYLSGDECSWMLDQCALYSVNEYLEKRGQAPALRRWDLEEFDYLRQRKLPKVAAGTPRPPSFPARRFGQSLKMV